MNPFEADRIFFDSFLANPPAFGCITGIVTKCGIVCIDAEIREVPDKNLLYIKFNEKTFEPFPINYGILIWNKKIHSVIVYTDVELEDGTFIFKYARIQDDGGRDNKKGS